MKSDYISLFFYKNNMKYLKQWKKDSFILGSLFCIDYIFLYSDYFKESEALFPILIILFFPILLLFFVSTKAFSKKQNVKTFLSSYYYAGIYILVWMCFSFPIIMENEISIEKRTAGLIFFFLFSLRVLPLIFIKQMFILFLNRENKKSIFSIRIKK